tara:strand:- start:9375 stop:11081 length:1707 start_codon:yes stop_codon:yes gene_type:complete
MSVSFRWGNQTLSLPKSKDYVQTQMRDYITEGQKSFRNKLRIARESVEESEVNLEKLDEELKSILETVLDDSLEEELKKEPSGWNRFSQLRRKQGQEPKPNTANVEFIKNKKLKDLSNNRVLGRLRGTDVSFIQSGITKLPDFDFESWYAKNKLKKIEQTEEGKKLEVDDFDVSYDITIRQHKGVGQEGKYTYGFDSDISGLKAHMEARFPFFDEGALIAAKTDFILEETGQEAAFRERNTKSKIGKETFDYAFDLPEKHIEQISGEFESKNTITEMKLVEDEDGNKMFEQVGEKMPMPTGLTEDLNIVVISAARMDLNRTDLMREEDIVQIGDKYYFYTFAESTREVRVKFPFDGSSGTPEGFFIDNEEAIMRILNKFLVVPDAVFSVKCYATIKNSKKTEQTYKDMALDAMKNIEDFSGKGLTPEQIEEQSKKAFSHKTKKNKDGSKIFISEEEYKNLSKEEKNNYKSEISVFQFNESEDSEGKVKRTFQTRSAADFGKEKFSMVPIPKDGLIDAFKNSIVVVEFEVTNHGEFNLSGARRSQNKPMANYVNKLKKNIRALKKMIGA